MALTSSISKAILRIASTTPTVERYKSGDPSSWGILVSDAGNAKVGLPAILLAIELPERSLARLRKVATVFQALTHAARMAMAVERGTEIRAIVTNGVTQLPAELIERLPGLGIVCAIAVGSEGIDRASTRARGIAITNGPGTNAECVADHTLGILLAALRRIPASDALVRAGGWRSSEFLPPAASGLRVGILGLGDIGLRVAKRCVAFNMSVAYHNRRVRPDVEWPWRPSPFALAEASDVLIVTLPGVTATRHLVGAAELAALGAGGLLVNVGRGSVVDTDALIEALESGNLAGAALDVVEGEPEIPARLLALPNVVLTPHVAGRSPHSVNAAIEGVLLNLRAFFSGEPLPTPVE